MKELKGMTIEELVNRVIFCASHLYEDVYIPKKELISRFAELEKALELMARKMGGNEILLETNGLYDGEHSLTTKEKIIQHFVEEADENI